MEQRDWPRDVPLGLPEGSLTAAGATLLEDGDMLVVPRSTGRVIVDGRVRQPGMVPWSEDLRVLDCIELAGGFDKNANKKRILVRRAGRPTGEAEHVKHGDRVYDGDLVWVSEKRPTSAWRYMQTTITVLAQIAAIVIIVDQISQ
jgi:protein involved in polysaccharide export with SLBB domain